MDIENAIKQYGVRRFAQQVGVRYQSVQDWMRAGKVPAHRVLATEKILGICRHQLRPDVFGPNDSRP